MENSLNYTVIEREDLPRDGNTFEFEGVRFPDTEVSFIWVDMPPGASIRLHKHPYQEIFIVQEGISRFVVGASTIDAHAGQIILVPAQVPHKFMNAGNTRLKQIDIHVSKQYQTDWLEE